MLSPDVYALLVQAFDENPYLAPDGDAKQAASIPSGHIEAMVRALQRQGIDLAAEPERLRTVLMEYVAHQLEDVYGPKLPNEDLVERLDREGKIWIRHDHPQRMPPWWSRLLGLSDEIP